MSAVGVGAVDGAVEEVLDEAADARERVAVLPTERLEAEITELAGQLAVAPDGTVASDGSGSGPSSGSAEPLEAANARRGVTVAAGTVMPDRYGPLDLDLALTALIPRDGPTRTAARDPEPG